MMGVNLTGQRFGRLVVIERSHSRKKPSGNFIVYWRCKCDCGNEVITQTNCLRRKVSGSKSCGCYKRDVTIKRNFKHGYSRTSEYNIWGAIKDRCFNPKNADFLLYGGRGITMCDRWKNSFENFISDMGKRPKGYSIDRINNDGNYEPDNCKWASATEQALNRRTSLKNRK